MKRVAWLVLLGSLTAGTLFINGGKGSGASLLAPTACMLAL